MPVPLVIVIVAAVGIGLFLPPVGVGLFIACGIGGVAAARDAFAERNAFAPIYNDNIDVAVGKTTVVNAKINTQASEVITVKERAPTRALTTLEPLGTQFERELRAAARILTRVALMC